MSTRRFLAVCGIWLPVLGTASAQALPPYSASRDAFFNLGARVTLADFGTLPLTDPRFGSILVEASGSPSPALRAQSDIGPNLAAGIFGRGSALLNYKFEVVGPQGQVPVVIDVQGTASGSATAGGSIAVESFWSFYFDALNPLAGDDLRSGQIFGAAYNQSFSRSVQLTLTANVPYTVSMLADAQAAATDAGSRASARALVDPVFSLGVGADPGLYSFQFSAGIGNTAAVPGPASAIAMALGLLVLGAATRRKGTDKCGMVPSRRAA
jgi:hypothetical protein